MTTEILNSLVTFCLNFQVILAFEFNDRMEKLTSLKFKVMLSLALLTERRTNPTRNWSLRRIQGLHSYKVFGQLNTLKVVNSYHDRKKTLSLTWYKPRDYAGPISILWNKIRAHKLGREKVRHPSCLGPKLFH